MPARSRPRLLATGARRSLLAAAATVGWLTLLSGTVFANPTNPATIWTIAGDGGPCASSTTTCGDGTPATSAQLNAPQGVAVGGAGNVYIADTNDNKIRKLTPAGALSTIAGNGGGCADATTSCGDGTPATSAQLNFPTGVAVDGAGNVYIADANDNKIRKLTPSGAISTIAGDGNTCASSTTSCGDGPTATSAQLNFPKGVAVDGAGNVYIADTNDEKIRELTPAGAISTIAGDGNTCASSTTSCGDGTSATSAQLSHPQGVAVDGAGNVYIADTIDKKIRELTPAGAISTIAGDGTTCTTTTSCGDGTPATSAQLNFPAGLAVDGAGNVYIADANESKIRELTAGGAISTIAGDGTACANSPFCGDGGAGRGAELFGPFGVAVDQAGRNVFIADTSDNLVRWLAAPQAGPQGPQGGQGPRGAPGPRGRPGRDARVTCKVKKSKKTKKVKVTCKVKYVSSKALAAELVRHGRVYARGHVGRRGVVRLHATHALHRGRYTLVVRTRGAHHRTAVARVRIRI